jgi:flagellar protein FlgJ
MKISPLHHAAAARPEPVPIEQLAGNKTLSEADKVTEASRQFEAVILRQILSQARKTVFHSKLNQDSTASGIYQDMVTSELAEAMSRNGGFGLARSLQAQVSPPVAAPSASSGHAPPKHDRKP